MSLPFVSVIIPVLNDKRIELCLSALAHQTYPKDRYEVIVVDNGSKNQVEIKKIVEKFPFAVFSHEPYPSSYAARNRGISLAKGEVLAFTDADCIPYNNWLEKGVNSLLDVPNCGLVGGRIVFFGKEPKRMTATRFYESKTYVNQELYVRNIHFAAACNLFTRREVIERVGAFESLLKSGGDFEFGRRVFGAGYTLSYEKEAVAFHFLRENLKAFLKRQQRIAGGLYELNCKRSSCDLKKFLLQQWPKKKDFIHYWKMWGKVNFFFKCRVAMIMYLVRLVRILEIIRLRLGGRPKRV